MPAAIAAAPAILGFAAGTVGAFVVATTVIPVLINVALGALARLLTKKPRVEAPPVNVTIRNPIENRRLVFGTVRTGGAFGFYDVSGENNKYLWYLIVLTGHQVSDIRDVWIDTIRIADSAIGGGSSAGGAVSSGVFSGKMWIYKHLGTGTQTVDVDLDSAFSAWTSNHRLRGCAYIVVKMERDDTAYPQGAPQNVTALVDGAKVYDPRLDSTNGGSGSHRYDKPSTWAFSRNPALIWRWFVTGGSVENTSTTRLIRYGLRELDSRIDDSFVIAAANRCEETLSGSTAPPSGSEVRYYCDLEVSTGETRRDVLEDILATMAGTHVLVHGKHRIYAGAYTAPLHSFTEKDLYGDLEVEDTVDHSRRYNRVAGVYRDASKEYVEQTTIFRTDSEYVTQDGGEEKPIEIDLRGVSRGTQAQRLCEIKLRESRMMRSVKLPGALNFLKVALGEPISFTHSRYGWVQRSFLCLDRHFEFNEGAGRVVLTCKRTDAAVFNDMLTADYTTGTSDTDTFSNETPDPPTGLKTTGRLNGILLEWTKAAVTFPGTTYEARMSTASAMTSPTTVYEGPDVQFILPRITTSLAYFQVRALRSGGTSAWHPTTNGVPGKASSVELALSASASPGSASSSSGASSQTTNSVTVTATGGTSPYTYAWTWASGGSSITINSNTSATTSFSATSLTSGQVRSGVARCTVTDNVSATFTVDVDVMITRPAATVSAPTLSLHGFEASPTDASAAFRYDSDGSVYSGESTSTPSTNRGLWVDPVEYAGDYQIRVSITGGTTGSFTSGPAVGGSNWHALSTDREWRLTETSTNGFKTIIFTVEIRRTSDSVVVATSTGNELVAQVEL